MVSRAISQAMSMELPSYHVADKSTQDITCRGSSDSPMDVVGKKSTSFLVVKRQLPKPNNLRRCTRLVNTKIVSFFPLLEDFSSVLFFYSHFNIFHIC